MCDSAGPPERAPLSSGFVEMLQGQPIDLDIRQGGKIRRPDLELRREKKLTRAGTAEWSRPPRSDCKALHEPAAQR
jgi:hypothetical protein